MKWNTKIDSNIRREGGETITPWKKLVQNVMTPKNWIHPVHIFTTLYLKKLPKNSVTHLNLNLCASLHWFDKHFIQSISDGFLLQEVRSQDCFYVSKNVDQKIRRKLFWRKKSFRSSSSAKRSQDKRTSDFLGVCPICQKRKVKQLLHFAKKRKEICKYLQHIYLIDSKVTDEVKNNNKQSLPIV